VDRQFKFQVAIRSKPGLSHPYRALITVKAADEGRARAAAIKKVTSGNPKYANRKKRDFWVFDEVKEIADE
jgi:hypothetical protein